MLMQIHLLLVSLGHTPELQICLDADPPETIWLQSRHLRLFKEFRVYFFAALDRVVQVLQIFPLLQRGEATCV